MGVNRHQKHLLVLPEDDANKDIANGFLVHWSNTVPYQVLRVASGWLVALQSIKSTYMKHLQKFTECRLVILIDFDGKFEERMNDFPTYVPDKLKERVFLLGCSHEPENARNATGRSFECMGRKLAEGCNQDVKTEWDTDHFRHNLRELERLKQSLR